MEQKMNSMNAPHIRGSLSTEKIMLYFVLALVPAGIHGVFLYGVPAAVVVLLTCVSAVVTEFIFEKAAKKRKEKK